MAVIETRSGSAPAAPSRYPNYVLGVLFLLTMLNFLDRQIITILAEPVKRDLGLSDTQIGLMTGLSFALFYTTLAIPVAALADKWNRSRIIAIAIAIWSAMTVFCGLATNFTQLFLARVGVGIGEAGSGPASHSLIADLFPPERRSGALGILGMAISVGALIAYAGGGWIVERFDWRIAFLMAGLPGIIIALIVWFTVHDPRGNIPLAQALKPDPDKIGLKEALRILSSKPAYWHLVAAGIVVQFVAYGLASFYGSLFVRVYDMGYGELGWKLGVMVGITGALGAWLGGKAGDHFGSLRATLPLVVTALVMVISVPGMIGALYASNGNLAMVLLAFPTFAATFYYGPNFSAIQRLASDETRAMAVAIYLLLAGIIGLGFGPVFVGILSDMFIDDLGGSAALQRALAILAFFNIWAGFHFWRAARRMPD